MSNTPTPTTMTDAEFIAFYEAKENARKARRRELRVINGKRMRERERVWRARPSSKARIQRKNQRQSIKQKVQRERYLKLKALFQPVNDTLREQARAAIAAAEVGA